MRKDKMQSQTRLMRRGARYYFRAKVPADLINHYDKREIVFSLKTSDPREAARLARVESVKLDHKFEQLRRGRPANDAHELRPEDIERLKAIWVHQWLAHDEEERASGLSDDAFENTENYLEHYIGELPEALINGDTKLIDGAVKNLLKDEGIQLDKKSDSYKKLAYALLQATGETLKAINERQQGGLALTPPAPAGAVTSRHTLRTLFEYWKGQDKRRPKTAHEFGVAVERFIDLHGNLRAHEIKKAHVVAFKDKLLGQGLARGTIQKQLGALSAVLQVAADNDKIPFNPARGVRLPRGKAEQKPRVSFEKEDLKKIFTSPIYVNNERPRGGGGEAAYWIPLIALYTGARLGEIGQLRVSDVKLEESINYFDITNEGEGNTLKTASSRRRVPIHPDLIKRGLLDFVERQRAAKQDRLFPALKGDHLGTLTGNWSKWFGRYLRKVVGIGDARKTFHSFRHTFEDVCREVVIETKIQYRLTGHAAQDVGDTYGADQYPLKPLAEAIGKLRFAVD